MNETIIPRDTRFVTIKAYCQMTGLSYNTVNHMLNTGQLKYITTEGGLRRVDTKDIAADQSAIMTRLDKQEKMLAALCKQFNTTVGG